jgi:hypothetical protein
MRHFLPSTAPAPEFSSTPAIVAWAQETARQVLAGNLDPRAAGEARQLASLTIAARQAEDQAAILTLLLRLEKGGNAWTLFEALRNGLVNGRELANGGRQPLPPRPMASSLSAGEEPPGS